MNKKHFKIFAACALTLIIGYAEASAYSQNQLGVNEDYLVEKLSDPNRQLTPNIYGYSKEQYEVVKRHERDLLTNKEFVRYLVRQMNQLGYLNNESIKNPEIHKKAAGFTATLASNLFTKGLMRLPYEDQFKILELWLIGVQRVSDEDCVCFFEGAPTVAMQQKMASNLMLSYYPNELERYYEIYRKAIFAEVADAPAVRRLSMTQYKFAEEALDNFIQKNLNQLDPKTRKLIATSMSPSASKAARCAGWKFTYDCALKVEGQTGEWLLQAFLNDMQ